MALISQLAKLTIKAETSLNSFSEVSSAVQFNPNEVSFTKSASWNSTPRHQRNSEDLQFTHGTATTLSIKLFFDTYETGEDVLTHTRAVANLTKVNGSMHRPPICKLNWGQWVIFQGVLTQLQQRYSLFLMDGTPVRAELDCTFTEWVGKTESDRTVNPQSPDVHKLHIVQFGDTLTSISSLHYDDPTLWRHIAQANRIDNPRDLTPGSRLRIPVLKS